MLPFLPAAPYLWPSVRMGIGILCLIIMISITVTTWRKGEYSLNCKWFSNKNILHFSRLILVSYVSVLEKLKVKHQGKGGEMAETLSGCMCLWFILTDLSEL